MHYLEFLRRLHDLLEPAAYLEIGLRNGDSLALSRCRSVGIDPAYSLTAELDGDYTVFRTTSDDFFARHDPLRATRGLPFDLAFIDGLHLFEYSLRDFIHAERYSRPGGVIVFDDVLPRSSDEAARERHTDFWTGDVYKMAMVLRRYRPELTVLTVDTVPTGLLLVLGLDPASSVLTGKYDEILAEYRTADPQRVPAAILARDGVLTAASALAAVAERLATTPLPDAPPPPDALPPPDGEPGARVTAALLAHDFRAEEASILESAEGALLVLPVPGVQIPHEVAGELRLGALAVPARLVPGAPARLQAWVSGLPGEYALSVRFGAAERSCGVLLSVGPAGELSVVASPPVPPAPPSAPQAASTQASVATPPSVPQAPPSVPQVPPSVPPPASTQATVATPPATPQWRAAARRVPGLRPLVRALRRGRG
jgi:hypothetical protein